MLAAIGSPAEWGAVSIDKLFWDEENGCLGIGIIAHSTIRFRIKGLGNTDSTYAYRTYDSSDNITSRVTDAGNFWIKGDCSALTFTDRSKYPETLKQAYDAVVSVTGKAGKVDHSMLHPFIRGNPDLKYDAEGKVTEIIPTRDIGATLSCLAEVIKDLVNKVAGLEKTMKP